MVFRDCAQKGVFRFCISLLLSANYAFSLSASERMDVFLLAESRDFPDSQGENSRDDEISQREPVPQDSAEENPADTSAQDQAEVDQAPASPTAADKLNANQQAIVVPKTELHDAKSQNGQDDVIANTSSSSQDKHLLPFDQFSLGLEFSRPSFSEEDMPFYKDYYGKESLMLGFRLDWDFLRNQYLAFGLLFRGSYYSDSGFASKNSQIYEKDENSPIDITLIPLQVGASLKITPFRKKWLVINGWYGYESLYFQETRGSLGEESTGTTSSSSASGSSKSNEDTGVLANKGWRRQTFLGLSLNILLNPLEEQSVKAATFLGIERVYLSPFYERSTPTKGKDSNGVRFKRSTYGAAFIFESRGI